MPNPNRKFNVSLNVLLDEETDHQICILAEETHLSKAQLVRQAVRHWHSMKYGQVASCADGQACRCPHAHLYPQQAAAPKTHPDGYMEAA